MQMQRRHIDDELQGRGWSVRGGVRWVLRPLECGSTNMVQVSEKEMASRGATAACVQACTSTAWRTEVPLAGSNTDAAKIKDRESATEVEAHGEGADVVV